MAAPVITASTRYYRPGTTKVYWVPSIASQASPTRAELNAGTDLSPEISSIDGWQTNSNTVDAPDLATRFAPKIAASIEVGDSSLTMYASSNSVDVRSLLPRDTNGYVVFLDEGDVAARKMDVFKVTVGSLAKVRDIGDPARITITFIVTATPSENVTIPA